MEQHASNKAVIHAPNKGERKTTQPCGCVFELQNIDGHDVLVVTPCAVGAACTYVQNAVAIAGDDHPVKVVL